MELGPMEAWLTELEKDMDNVPSLMGNPFEHYQQSERMELSFDEQLVATLGEDFPYPISVESDIPSPELDFDYNAIQQFTSALPDVLNDNANNIDNNNNNNNNNNDIVSSDNDEGTQQSKNKKVDVNKQEVSGSKKRKRHPSQVQDHIIAERKRRELLGQMFISLSAIVPGLKKTDKTSVLGEAIKHMKQLQEKVEVLEKVTAKRTVESIVVKKSLLNVDNDGGDDNDTSSTVDDNCVFGSSGGASGAGGGSGGNGECHSLPEMEVKISGNTLLLRIYCEERKGILANLFAELEKHEIIVTNCSVLPFDCVAKDITVVAQMGKEFSSDIKDFIRSVRSAL